MKHAYLILAHNEFEVLQKLLQALDDERNDVFIHFDAKLQSLPLLSMKRSKLYIIRNRVKVYWADFSMVQAELNLLQEAVQQDTYDYFHFLSGVDMPLKSQDEIHRFFHENAGKEFIDYCLYDVTEELTRKMKRWHLFPKNFKNTGGLNIVTRSFRALFLRIQIATGWYRNRSLDFKKGSQWCSITEAFARYLLEHHADISRIFTHTFCPDEVMMQTLCWNSPFREHLYDVSMDYKGHMRLIDWGRGRPYVWQENDWDELKVSDRLFARKFSAGHIGIVNRLLEAVQTKDGYAER